MKSLKAFAILLVEELGQRCDISTTRDCQTISRRVDHEGISFLTITLANLGKGFQKSLDQGYIDSSLFAGFSRNKGLPAFLQGFLSLVFDSKTGVLSSSPSIDAIQSLHQIYSGFAKVRIECTEDRIQRALDGYVACEQEVRVADARRNPQDIEDFRRVSRLLFSEGFNKINDLVYRDNILPKHGPGATAERLSSNGKYSQLNWTTRLEEVFSFAKHLFPNLGWYQSYQDVNFFEPGEELPVRVITVPKTLKTPRIIAIEPVYMQYMQQGLLEQFKEMNARDFFLRSFIDDSSQIPNQELARIGSIDGSLATLDLSEASDRVSNQLVRILFADHSWLSQAVDATRSRKADVPGRGIIRLAKFASMGSALCFPVEAMVFLTIVLIGIERASNTRVSRALLRELVGKVRVYGDDIIVPVDYMSMVRTTLEDFGLKVNGDKSFGTGKFRESCGGDFYDGVRITPIRVRSTFPSRITHVDELVSTVALRNQFFDAGYTTVVQALDALIDEILPVYPCVPRTSSALGRWTDEPILAQRVHPNYQTPQIRACVVDSKAPSDQLDGVGALMKYFLKRSDKPFEDREHLLRAGRPKSARIRTRWVTLVKE